jgi:hypothetical protein
MLPKALWGEVILHDDASRLEHVSDKDMEQSKKRLHDSAATKSQNLIKRYLCRPNPRANPDGNVGMPEEGAKIYLNFSATPYDMQPLPKAELKPAAVQSWASRTQAPDAASAVGRQ